MSYFSGYPQGGNDGEYYPPRNSAPNSNQWDTLEGGSGFSATPGTIDYEVQSQYAPSFTTGNNSFLMEPEIILPLQHEDLSSLFQSTGLTTEEHQAVTRRTEQNRIRRRTPMACNFCRKRKMRCVVPEGETVCVNCDYQGKPEECNFNRVGTMSPGELETHRTAITANTASYNDQMGGLSTASMYSNGQAGSFNSQSLGGFGPNGSMGFSGGVLPQSQMSTPAVQQPPSMPYVGPQLPLPAVPPQVFAPAPGSTPQCYPPPGQGWGNNSGMNYY